MSGKTRLNLTGQQFGTLVVIDETERSQHGQRMWNCICTCGNKRTVLQHSLTSGNTKTCGDHPKNNYTTYDDYVLLDVSTPKLPETFTKISLDDLHKVINFKAKRGGRLKWMAHDNHRGRWGIYVSATDRKTRLHRLIMDLTDPTLQIDHINGDTLDNRRENLRIVTPAENAKNVRKRINNTSGYTGVWFNKNKNLWTAEIQLNNRKIHIGNYDEKYEANIAYRAAAKVLGFSERHGL